MQNKSCIADIGDFLSPVQRSVCGGGNSCLVMSWTVLQLLSGNAARLGQVFTCHRVKKKKKKKAFLYVPLL